MSSTRGTALNPKGWGWGLFSWLVFVSGEKSRRGGKLSFYKYVGVDVLLTYGIVGILLALGIGLLILDGA